MAITSVTGGSVLIQTPVHFKAIDLAELNAALPNPAYNDKTFRFNNGNYAYVNIDGLVSESVREISVASVISPTGLNISSSSITPISFSSHQDDYDPAGTGNLDNVTIVYLSSTSNNRRIRGLVPANTSQPVFFFNQGNFNINLRNQDSNSLAIHRWDIGSNMNVPSKTGFMAVYNTNISRWQKIL